MQSRSLVNKEWEEPKVQARQLGYLQSAESVLGKQAE